MATGIHAVLTKPAEIQIAPWEPEDETQRGLVLGWLVGYFADGSTEFYFEIDSEGNLILDIDDDQLEVAPGEVIALDPVSGVLGALHPEDVDVAFDYDRPLVDPNQPTLF